MQYNNTSKYTLKYKFVSLQRENTNKVWCDCICNTYIDDLGMYELEFIQWDLSS